MLQENIVKVVSRYAVGSVTLYTIWRLFVFRYTCNPRYFDSRGAAPLRHLPTDSAGKWRGGAVPQESKCQGLYTC